MSRVTLLALATVVVVGSMTACATSSYGQRSPQSRQDGRLDDRAYRDGFDRGRTAGLTDARSGRSSDYTRHGEYRNTRRGNDSYRQGFVSGYNEGYGQYRQPSRHPQTTRPRYNSPASDNGYRDGVAAGRDDARKGRQSDPILAKRYREGDNGYNSRYGSLDQYKRDYRAAFQQGYAQGYREARRR
jgi:Ni/Co efflux regulator RcnB